MDCKDIALTLLEDDNISHYEIYHRQTKKVVGKAKTRNGARASVDRNDNKYGGYAHTYRPVYKDANKENGG